jgi:hypothetical protein
MSASACSGNCSAGYACAAGSVNATASVCPPGTFSLAGAGTCSDCAAGRFGNASGLGVAACSGLCPGGRYGGGPGLSLPSCTAACEAGYACAPGSVVPTALQCPQGRFSVSGAAFCSECPAGTFSDALGLPQACTRPCPPGSFCVAGSVAPAACPAGRYGAAPSLTNASCTAPCPLGSFCVGGSIAPSSCPAGWCARPPCGRFVP